MKLKVHWLMASCALLLTAVSPGGTADRGVQTFVQNHCAECHDAETKKGDLDLTALKLDLANPTNFSKWVLVHDRVAAGEMPPKAAPQPTSAARASFLTALSRRLLAVAETRVRHEGRSRGGPGAASVVEGGRGGIAGDEPAVDSGA